MKIMWFGMGGSRYLAEDIFNEDFIKKHKDVEFMCLSEWAANDKRPDITYIKWDKETWLGEIQNANLIVLPVEKNKPAKSDNRLVISVALGKRAICSSTDAYKEFVDKYEISVVNLIDSKNMLETFTEANEFRMAINWAINVYLDYKDSGGKLGTHDKDILEAVKRDYSLTQLMEGYIQVLDNLISNRKQQQGNIAPPTQTKCSDVGLSPYHHPKALVPNKLSVIMPVKYYSGRERIVDNAISSIRREIKKTGLINYEIYIVRTQRKDIASVQEIPFKNDTFSINVPWNTSFTEAINAGIKATDGELLLITNDDIYAGYNSIEEMIKTLRNNLEVAQVNPVSNCDKGWLHNNEYWIGNSSLTPDMAEDTFKGKEGDIFEFTKKFYYNEKFNAIEDIPFCPLYFTMIRRNVLEGMGGRLDESMKMVYSDKELSDRFHQLNFRTVIQKNIFVLHYGAKTRKLDEKEDAKRYHNTDTKDNAAYNKISFFREKKKRVILYSGPSWEQWNSDTVDGGMGGSESCQAYLATALAKLDYKVISLCDFKQTGLEFIEVLPGHVIWDHFKNVEKYGHVDYFVSIRQPQLPFKPDADKLILWSHDIWYGNINTSLFFRYDVHVLLSPWHRDYWLNEVGLKELTNSIHIIPDGVNLNYYPDNLIPWRKNSNQKIKLIYSSSSDRGLDKLLDMYDQLYNEGLTNIELHIYYGFYNLLEYGKKMNKEIYDWGQALLERIKHMKGMGVYHHDRVGKKELAEAFQTSDYWVYPTMFHETFCITALEAMLGGCIPVYMNLAALQTTIPFQGQYKIEGNINDNMNYKMFYDMLRSLIKEYPENTYELLTKNRLYAKSFAWNKIAMRWNDLFKKLHNERVG